MPINAEAIRRELEELKRMQSRLEAMLEQAEPEVADPENKVARHKLLAEVVSDTPKGRPVRTVVLDALQDLEWPAYTRELTLYCQARYGRSIPPTRFGTLAADEEKSFRRPGRQPRTLWLSFALTSDRHQPIKRLLTRSDWPLSRRIVAPTTGRIQHLWMTRQLCYLALTLGDRIADPEMFKIIAADHARDVLGIGFRRGQFDLGGWRDAADAQLEELLPEDEQLREESAARLARRPDWFQLFGAPEIIEGERNDHHALGSEA